MAAISRETARTTRKGFRRARRCSEFLAEANWGSTRYSKTNTMHPALRMMRISRGIENRRFVASVIRFSQRVGKRAPHARHFPGQSTSPQYNSVVRLLVVLPTYNEVLNVETMLRTLRTVVPDAHILVVDDASPDQTADLAQRTAQELEQIYVLRREG